MDQRYKGTVIGYFCIACIRRTEFVNEIQCTARQVKTVIIVVLTRAVRHEEEACRNRIRACRVGEGLSGNGLIAVFNQDFFRAKNTVCINREHTKRVGVSGRFTDICYGDRIAFTNGKVTSGNAERLLLNAVQRFGFIEVWQSRTGDECFFNGCTRTARGEGFIAVCTIGSDCQLAVCAIDGNRSNRWNIDFIAFERDFDNLVVGIGGKYVRCARAAIEAGNNIACRNARCRIVSIDVVVCYRRIIDNFDNDVRVGGIAVAIRCANAEIQFDNIVRVCTVFVIEVVKQFEFISARRRDFQREDRNAACRTHIGIADDGNDNRNAFVRQLIVQF